MIKLFSRYICILIPTQDVAKDSYSRLAGDVRHVGSVCGAGNYPLPFIVCCHGDWFLTCYILHFRQVHMYPVPPEDATEDGESRLPCDVRHLGGVCGVGRLTCAGVALLRAVLLPQQRRLHPTLSFSHLPLVCL